MTGQKSIVSTLIGGCLAGQAFGPESTLRNLEERGDTKSAALDRGRPAPASNLDGHPVDHRTIAVVL